MLLVGTGVGHISGSTTHDNLISSYQLASASLTTATYSTGIRKFREFCHKFNEQALIPATKQTVVYLIAVAMSRSLAPSTTKAYLSAVASWHRQNNMEDPTRHNHLLKLALRGAQRAYALCQTSTAKRQPITTSAMPTNAGT